MTFCQILPNLALRVRVAQQIGRVIRGEQFVLRKSNQLPANREMGSSFSGMLRGDTARQTIAFGADHVKLAVQIRRARGDFSSSGLRFSGGRHFTTLQM